MAASSSTVSSSRCPSIPSPPPADVSRETSTLGRLVDVSRASTSASSPRVAVERLAGVVVPSVARVVVAAAVPWGTCGRSAVRSTAGVEPLAAVSVSPWRSPDGPSRPRPWKDPGGALLRARRAWRLVAQRAMSPRQQTLRRIRVAHAPWPSPQPYQRSGPQPYDRRGAARLDPAGVGRRHPTTPRRRSLAPPRGPVAPSRAATPWGAPVPSRGSALRLGRATFLQHRTRPRHLPGWCRQRTLDLQTGPANHDQRPLQHRPRQPQPARHRTLQRARTAPWDLPLRHGLPPGGHHLGRRRQHPSPGRPASQAALSPRSRSHSLGPARSVGSRRSLGPGQSLGSGRSHRSNRLLHR